MFLDVVDESENEGPMLTGNEEIANMSQLNYDDWHNYCPIQNKLQYTSTTTILRIARR